MLFLIDKKNSYLNKNLQIHLVRDQDSPCVPALNRATFERPCPGEQDRRDEGAAAAELLPDVFSELLALSVVKEPLPPPAPVQPLQHLHHLFQLACRDSTSRRVTWGDGAPGTNPCSQLGPGACSGRGVSPRMDPHTGGSETGIPAWPLNTLTVSFFPQHVKGKCDSSLSPLVPPLRVSGRSVARVSLLHPRRELRQGSSFVLPLRG